MNLMRAYLCYIFTILALYGQIPEPNRSCEGSWFPDGTYIPRGEEREVIIDGKRYRCVGCGGCTLLESSDAREEPPSPGSPGLPPWVSPPSGGGYSSEDIRRAKAEKNRKKEWKEITSLRVDYGVFYKELKKAIPDMPTEYDALRRLEREAQYLYVDMGQLEELESKYANDTEVLRCIRSLEAKRKVMEAIERLASEYTARRAQREITQREAKREVERALAELASIRIPGADYVDEWINAEITGSESVGHVAREGVVAYIQSIFKEEKFTTPTTPSQIKATLGLLKKAVVVHEYYSVIDKSVKSFSYLRTAWEKYVEAVEMREYVRGVEKGPDLLKEWFRLRNEALEDSRRLYYLIQQRQK